MTQLEFIKKISNWCNHYGTKTMHFDVESEQSVMLMFLDNQNNVWVNDYVDVIGFDEDNHFYIDFVDTMCRAYMSELDKNDDSCWDELWEAILDVSPDYVSPHNLKVGDKVRWNDPGIDDYPIEDRAEARNRVFTIHEIKGEDMDSIILITDGCTEVETTANELVLVKPITKVNYFEQYRIASYGALNDSLDILKSNNMYDIINIEDKDVYVHCIDENGTFEYKVHTIQLEECGTRIIVGAKDFDDEDYITDLEDGCLLADYIFVYEAIVEYLNEIMVS